MFRDLLLHELQALQREADDPERDIILGDDTRSDLLDRMCDVIELNLKPLNRKKALEINRLVRFALNYPQFPDGSVSLNERPDFIVTTQDRKIGIELMDVYVQLPGRAAMKWQERIKDQIVKQAMETHTQAGGAPLRVLFGFADNTNFRESDVSRVAQQLVNCVPASLASSREDVIVDRHDPENDWPAELASVVGHAPHYLTPNERRWDACHGGAVYSSEKFIQAAVDQKEKKIRDYQTSGCDELWLLLVVPGFAASSFLDTPRTDHVFNSSFDRVFGLWLADREIVELKCVRPYSDGQEA